MTAHIGGWAMSSVGLKLRRTPTSLVKQALSKALDHAKISVAELDGFVACPSLARQRFMEAHWLAGECGLLPPAPGHAVRVRTLDTGGAGPVSMLLQAKRMVEVEGCSAVAVVAGDSVSSLPSREFLARADESLLPRDPYEEITWAEEKREEKREEARFVPPTPVIPHTYSHVTQAQMARFGVTREQLAMVSVLMSAQAARHPHAVQREQYSLQEVLDAPQVAPHVGLLECARKADGAAAVIVLSAEFASSLPSSPSSPSTPSSSSSTLVIAGGAEAAGSLSYPFDPKGTLAGASSAAAAFRLAYHQAGLTASDVDYFGIYDCFPICFLRGVEAAGLAEKGGGGKWIEEKYSLLMRNSTLPPDLFPINTHGGLLSFGAPWEVPALFSVVEACEQLSASATQGARQVSNCTRAAVYGNGGVFTASAVAILEKRQL